MVATRLWGSWGKVIRYNHQSHEHPWSFLAYVDFSTTSSLHSPASNPLESADIAHTCHQPTKRQRASSHSWSPLCCS